MQPQLPTLRRAGRSERPVIALIALSLVIGWWRVASHSEPPVTVDAVLPVASHRADLDSPHAEPTLVPMHREPLVADRPTNRDSKRVLQLRSIRTADAAPIPWYGFELSSAAGWTGVFMSDAEGLAICDVPREADELQLRAFDHAELLPKLETQIALRVSDESIDVELRVGDRRMLTLVDGTADRIQATRLDPLHRFVSAPVRHEGRRAWVRFASVMGPGNRAELRYRDSRTGCGAVAQTPFQLEPGRVGIPITLRFEAACELSMRVIDAVGRAMP